MYKEVTYRYDKYTQKNMQKVVNIYFDNVLIDPTYITEFKKGGTLFNKELELGSTPSQYIELKIHKSANIQIPQQIRVEFGVLVNNALTLYEVNKMLLGELNVTPLRSLAKHNYDFEMVPIGIFNVDEYIDKDSNLITIKAHDNIIKLENDSGYYDITSILKQDSAGKKYATLGEIAEDICKKKGLELGSKSFINSTKKMYVYDNSITAREYMGYIAECAGCFACSGRDGKIYFRNIGEDTIEIPQNLFKTYKYGEQYKISRVAYENGLESFKFGAEVNNTLWINQDNIFITDEDEVRNIYNKMKDLTVYSFEGIVVIDPRIDIGDIININGKKIIYQGEITFGGRPRANIKSKISMKARSETTVRIPSQKTLNRRVQSRIDEEAGKIEQLIKETTESTKNITETIKDNKKQVDDFINQTFLSSIKNIQNQIDGAIQFWNGTAVPTLSNYPASNWKTEDEKVNHTADIYTVISGGKQGKSYRFDKVNGTWKWIELTDNEVSAIAELAQKAQSTADKKMRVFIEQPFPPYQIGDLWIKDEELYKCNTNKETGIFVASEWEKAVKYTDDTTANAVDGKLTTTIEKVNSVTDTANSSSKTIAIIQTDVKTLTDISGATTKHIEKMETSFKDFEDETKKVFTFTKKIEEDGVEKLNTKTGYTFDSDGLTIDKTGAETKSKFDETGMLITDNTGSSGEKLLFAGYDKEKGETVVETKNLTVEKYFCMGKNLRVEDYQEGTGFFYTGEG